MHKAVYSKYRHSTTKEPLFHQLVRSCRKRRIDIAFSRLEALQDKDYTRTVPKAAVPCGVRHLVSTDTDRDGDETILTSPSISNRSRIVARVDGISSPLTLTPVSSAGQTDVGDNIIEIGFPIIDTHRLRIVDRRHLEDLKNVHREWDP